MPFSPGKVPTLKTDLPHMHVIFSILGQKRAGKTGRPPVVSGDLPGFPGVFCPGWDADQCRRRKGLVLAPRGVWGGRSAPFSAVFGAEMRTRARGGRCGARRASGGAGLPEPGGPDGPVDDGGDGQGHRGEDQEDPEVGGDFVAPEAEVELFVDPVVVFLRKEFEVGVPGCEEDLAGVGGGDKLDGEGREFVLLFPEGRVRVGVVLHLVVERLEVVQHVHRALAALAVFVRGVFLDVQGQDAEQRQADGHAGELEDRRHERQDADGHRHERNHDRHLVGDVVGREIEVGGIADLEAPLGDTLEEVLLLRGYDWSLHNWQNFRFLQS